MPESVRWLLANGKGADAKEIIQEAARTNKVPLPDYLLNLVDKEEASKKPVARASSVSLSDVFRSRVICMRTLNMCYQVSPHIGPSYEYHC